jgi:hypothetical protein
MAPPQADTCLTASAVLLASLRSIRVGLHTVVLLGLAGGAAVAQPPPGPTIERLIGDGWEIAGYITAWENRSLILFKHKEHKYLVQCSVLTDVLRNPRIVTNCYELR